MRKFIVKYDDPTVFNKIFLNMVTAHGKIGEVEINFLVATNMGIAVEKGDNFVAEFEIGKKI